MLLVSIMFTYFTVPLLAINAGPDAYNWGFILGRAITGVLLSLFFVWLVRFLFRRKPMFTKGALISWWIVFIFLSALYLLGSIAPPQS